MTREYRDLTYGTLMELYLLLQDMKSQGLMSEYGDVRVAYQPNHPLAADVKGWGYEIVDGEPRLILAIGGEGCAYATENETRAFGGFSENLAEAESEDYE
jgi:hypothetical protein